MVSFQLSQLAQVTFYLTLFVGLCAVMRDKWFDKTAAKRRRRSFKTVLVKIYFICWKINVQQNILKVFSFY